MSHPRTDSSDSLFRSPYSQKLGGFSVSLQTIEKHITNLAFKAPRHFLNYSSNSENPSPILLNINFTGPENSRLFKNSHCRLELPVTEPT
ncbi:hypothetical protein NPIL_162221 [Nephila pilipes]|uniref:Uncharacterized protein n=1 Tax=Nephila pilipes TaxID=299642 RepID=A0A8X6U938_NEPPI|nr:hypothetical protein NPIL_162221 [Nephila pilipes]